MYKRQGYNHAAAFAQDAALFFKTDDGDKEKCYLIELAAKGLGLSLIHI